MFACIYVPDFPVEAIVRAEPLLRELAVAVLEGKPPLTRVISLNEKARSLGMETGMTKLQATVFAESTEPTKTASGNQRRASIDPSTQLNAGYIAAAFAWTGEFGTLCFAGCCSCFHSPRGGHGC